MEINIQYTVQYTVLKAQDTRKEGGNMSKGTRTGYIKFISTHHTQWPHYPNDFTTLYASCPNLCSVWWGWRLGRRETCRRCVHPGYAPPSPRSPRRSSWPPLTDRARYEPGGPARERKKRDSQYKINGRTWCTWIVIRYDMKVNGC